MTEDKIIVNQARCKKCGDKIESRFINDFKRCSCGSIAVDGGQEYIKRMGNLEDVIELSMIEEDIIKNLKPFDFSKNINNIELYQHLCYYHNEANDNMQILKENKELALDNFKKLYRLLRNEDIEYSKVKNHKYIMLKPVISQYVKNIGNAYAKPTRVTSYLNLSSNLYDVQDYMKYGFGNIFCLTEKYDFNRNDLDDYLGKICVVELNNFNIYVGMVDLKLFDIPSENDESISILFLNNWKQIEVEKIKRIKILEN